MRAAWNIRVWHWPCLHFSNGTPECAFPTSPVWDLTAAPFDLALQGGPQVPKTAGAARNDNSNPPGSAEKTQAKQLLCTLYFFSFCPVLSYDKGNSLLIDGLGKKVVHGRFCRGNANVISRAGNQSGNSLSGKYREEDGGGCLPHIDSNCLSSDYLSCHGPAELSLQPSLVPTLLLRPVLQESLSAALVTAT